MLSACSNETKFVDKGKKRIVGENESIAEVMEKPDKKTFSDIPIIKTISENNSGHFEGNLTVNAKDNDINYDVTLDVSEDKNIKLGIHSEDTEFSILYFNDSMELFVINPSGNEYFMDTKRIILNNFACIKDHMYQYAIYAANNNGFFSFTEDNKSMMLNCNSSTVFSAICEIFDQVNENYSEVYRLTKEDKSFMSFAREMFNDTEHELSEGLSKNAMNDFTEAYCVIAQRKLLSETDKLFSFTLTVNDDLDLEYEMSVVDEENKPLYTIKGDLEKTDKATEVIARPKDIDDYREKEDDSSQVDIRADNDDIAPQDEDTNPEEPEEWEDNSFFEGKTDDSDWISDDFFKK
ncbi:hypothetical protein [Ruminococcus albus]|jgi:hypothetical protein|uniref:Uncharacterized protein n=1 Tax=Ruminococcus albus (strain ATCC 27210 / DSM 20455 / JCM 14654 / NCDO 2250 / 7) TaxID=697329 RepID=E6UJY1_RUMA7|nr:hypothetical protein [Ruminococcus albus]ADU23977.1 hypothetical protein Rumal_3535 [Ruminococcus albus 7 = DSM 20455]